MTAGNLTFDCIYSDVARLIPGESSSIPLFQNGSFVSSDRITEEDERLLVRWMLSDDARRKLIFEKLCPTSGRFLDSIQDRQFARSRKAQGGDIDLVLLEGDSPAQGVCVEFKKVKVRVDASGRERINGLEGLEKLIAQGSARQSMGFRRTYICAIAVIDNHQLDTPNVFLRRGNKDDYQRFYQLHNLSGIHQDVGVILVEIFQPTGKSYDSMYGMGICKVKEAGVLEQPTRLTEDLRSLFRRRGMDSA